MGRAELTRPISADDVEEICGIEIDLRDFDIADDLEVLDIGAGGDAVIFQSIQRDIYGLEAAEEEIYVTKEKGIEERIGAIIHWIQGDAREMPVEDAQFDVVTSFFTCMYIRDPESKQKLFDECYRVLKNDGTFYMWDFSITTNKQVFVGKLNIILPNDRTVSASYGIGGEQKDQTLQSIIEYANEAGFHCVNQEQHNPYFYLEFKKR
jgi:ubiquinone/menaquinone biosynthesis C-methylase UbiE